MKKIKSYFFMLFSIILFQTNSFGQTSKIGLFYLTKDLDFAKDIVSIEDNEGKHYTAFTLISEGNICITKYDFSSLNIWAPIWSKSYTPIVDLNYKLFRIINYNRNELAVLAKIGDYINVFFINKANGSLTRSYKYSGQYLYQSQGILLNSLSGIDMIISTEKDTDFPNLFICGSIHLDEKIDEQNIKNSMVMSIRGSNGAVVWAKNYSSGKHAMLAIPPMTASPYDYDNFNEIKENKFSDSYTLILTGTQNQLTRSVNPLTPNYYSNDLKGNFTSINPSNGNKIINSMNSTQNGNLLSGATSCIDYINGNILTAYDATENFIHFTLRSNSGNILIDKKIQCFYFNGTERTPMYNITPYNITQNGDKFLVSFIYRDQNFPSTGNNYLCGSIGVLEVDKNTLQITEHIIGQLYGINNVTLNSYIEDVYTSPIDYYHKSALSSQLILFYFPNFLYKNSHNLYYSGINLNNNQKAINVFKSDESLIPSTNRCTSNSYEFEYEDLYDEYEDNLSEADITVINTTFQISENDVAMNLQLLCDEGTIMKPKSINPEFYPNPFTDIVNVSNIEPSKIEIMNVFGIENRSIIWKYDNEKTEIDLGILEKGLYRIRITDTSGKVYYYIVQKQ